jgi:hypothetical protein
MKAGAGGHEGSALSQSWWLQVQAKTKLGPAQAVGKKNVFCFQAFVKSGRW